MVERTQSEKAEAQMGTKGRTKFVVAGSHPLLQLLRDRLIHTGYALVPWSETPDFCLFGAQLLPDQDVALELSALAQQVQGICGANIPVILLSAGQACGDESMLQALVTPGVLGAGRKMYTYLAEHLFLRGTSTLVLRFYNYYGPNINWGVIHEFVMAARRQEPLRIHGSGYQTRSFLHEDDLLQCFDLVMKHYHGLERIGVRAKPQGVYNVGHDVGHSIKRTADSVIQLMKKHKHTLTTVRAKADDQRYHVQNKVPDIARTKSVFGWEPKISLRAGLWRLLE